nr:hypothetical protein [Candidatus Sigynarchaeum springense]
MNNEVRKKGEKEVKADLEHSKTLLKKMPKKEIVATIRADRDGSRRA